MVWYSHLFKNFPHFVVIHIVKGFGIVNKAEVDITFMWTLKKKKSDPRTLFTKQNHRLREGTSGYQRGRVGTGEG